MQNSWDKPQYIIIKKNTEVFKKGGVFEYYSSFYVPVGSSEDVYVANLVVDKSGYISHEQVDVLLDKKVAAPAVRFDPAFVTLGENEVLQKALEDHRKPKKKTSAKKTTTKK